MNKNYFLLLFAFLCLTGLNAQTVHWSEDFSTGIPAGWNNADEDLDGQFWVANSGFISSFSADPNNGWNQLNPDNWLVTDAIDLSAVSGSITLKWDVQCPANYGSEQYDIYVATANDLVSLAVSPVTFGENPQNTQAWEGRTLDISSFAGSSTVYVAIRHHDTNWNEELQIDNFSIESPPSAQYEITYNIGQSLSQSNSFTCGPNDRVARHFDLADFGIPGAIELLSIDLGIWQHDIEETITVNVYESDGTFVGGSNPAPETLIGTEDFTLDIVNFQNSNFLAEMKSYAFTTPIVVPSYVTHIIVEYIVPNAVGANFSPAQGVGLGEPAYYGTDGCGGPHPLNTPDFYGLPLYEYFISLDANDGEDPLPSTTILIEQTFNDTVTSSVSTAQCTNGQNAYGRNFSMDAQGLLGTAWSVEYVDVGIYRNDAPQDVEIRIWDSNFNMPDSDQVINNPANLLGQETFSLGVFDGGLIKNFVFSSPVTVPSISTHVFIEIVFPNPGAVYYEMANVAAFEFTDSIWQGDCNGPDYEWAWEIFGFNPQGYLIRAYGSQTLSNPDFITSENEVILYPNPTSDILNIKLSSNNTIVNVTVFDMLGKVQNVNSTNNQINLSSISSGVYILQVETNNGLISKQIIKK
ncbi:hypothetical protein A9Q87_03050 [Flavobacteriales bacterium 34_180_T64]|nr:hypothetical protein A9Q87_03050 [Flavobacteriales bacterium 34_180_T64]